MRDGSGEGPRIAISAPRPAVSEKRQPLSRCPRSKFCRVNHLLAFEFYRVYINFEGALKMRNLDSRIKKIVRDTLSHEFDRIRILEVKIHKDVDSDGDDVLRIDVIFEGQPK